MREVKLVVNHVEYSGWETIEITRSLETLCGSFQMSVSERWNGQTEPWPIREGDECTVYIGDETLIVGYVDRRSMSISANQHTFTVAGRDRAGDLIDCSSVLDAWEFNGVTVLKIVTMVAEQFGVGVTVQDGVELPPTPKRIVINPGETAYDVIDRATRLAGLFAMSDAKGGIVLTKAGAGRAVTPLIEGQNILEATADYDASQRYSRYIVNGQQAGGDLLFGIAAADVRAEASDINVQRPSRVLMIRGEGSITIKQAQDRANWEATVRCARAETLNVTVQGWRQANGRLWPVNSLVTIQAPYLGVDGDWLISEVTYSLSASGTLTELTLRPAAAYLPEPEVPENEAKDAAESGGEE